MCRILLELVEIIGWDYPGHAVILVGWILGHGQDFTGLGIHGNRIPTGNAVVSVLGNIPIINIPFQD